MSKTDDDFLVTLPRFVDFEDVADPSLYRPLPDGWVLAIADIVDSTSAIDSGHYKSVNMAGAGVISALLNALDRHDLPFVFGGDGAAVVIPPGSVDVARDALSRVLSWVSDDMGLVMRAAMVPVDDIRGHGFDIRVARFSASDDVTYAMFSGGGNSWAEAEMKNGRYKIEPAPAGNRPDLSGLSCRWNPIAARRGRIVSIITVPGATGDMQAFRALISELVELSDEDGRGGHPVPVAGPDIGMPGEGVEMEARAQAGRGESWTRFKRKLAIVTQVLLVSVLSRLNVSFGRFNAERYRQGVARNTDFRKFDDGLKMTIDVDAGRLSLIRNKLEAAAASGVCYYGLHEQDEALMTCIVPSPLTKNHMHFVDGASGGYAKAASYLKAHMQAAGH